MRNSRILVLVEVALAIALAVVLNFIQIRLPINFAGGSVSPAMLPILVIALRRGALAGASAGTVFGLIDLLIEPYILLPIQVILDYPLPYLLFGLGAGALSGLYKKTAEKSGRPSSWRIMLGTLTVIAAAVFGGLLRLFCHVVSGVLFFAENAAAFFDEVPTLLLAGPVDKGLNLWIYSTGYNAPYVLLSLILVIVCAAVVLPTLNKAVPAETR